MNTVDTVLLIIVTSLLGILLLVAIAVAVAVYKLIATVKRVAEKAEDVVESVESAAEVFNDTKGNLAFLKLIRNIVKLAQRSRK
jgi:uncharacterized protein (UPF0335 family)